MDWDAQEESWGLDECSITRSPSKGGSAYQQRLQGASIARGGKGGHPSDRVVAVDLRGLHQAIPPWLDIPGEADDVETVNQMWRNESRTPIKIRLPYSTYD